MKKVISSLLLAALSMLLAGCQYDAPLSEEHNIPVDSSVLGLWAPADQKDVDQRMLVLKYSDTEYLIHYPAGKNGIYYRGYPINVGGRSCVQLEVIGTADSPVDPDEAERFQVASYAFQKGLLEVRLLNPKVVDHDLKDSEDLREAFLKNVDNPNLFADPMKFKSCIVVRE